MSTEFILIMDKSYGVKIYKICFVFSVILVNCLVCGKPFESPPPNADTVPVPVIAVYMFGSVLLLLVLLLIFLVLVLLKKSGFLDIFKRIKTAAIKVEQQTNTDTLLTEVKSMNRLNLDRSNSFEFKFRDTDNQTLRTNDGTETLQMLKNEQIPESSGNLSPRIMKFKAKDMPIILPEQMSRICKEVLIRTNKNEDTGGSLQNIDQLAKETMPKDEPEKKNSSTPDLDVYDVPAITSEIAKKRIEKNDTNKDEKEIDKKTKITPDFNKNNESQPDDIYDMPKEVMTSSLNYIEPSFLFEPTGQAKQNPKDFGPKPAYTLWSDLINVENMQDDFKDNRELDHYKFPNTPNVEKKLYVNANDVSFGSLNAIDTDKEKDAGTSPQ